LSQGSLFFFAPWCSLYFSWCPWCFKKNRQITFVPISSRSFETPSAPRKIKGTPRDWGDLFLINSYLWSNEKASSFFAPTNGI
jgi:hypothetical protein